MKHYIFNYSHDIQLANGADLYNPTRTIAAFERDMQPLAAFCTQPFDTVIVEPERVSLCEQFYASLLPYTITFAAQDIAFDHTPEVWGWDTAIRQKCLHMAHANSRGALENISNTYLNNVRKFSSRQFTVQVLAELRCKLKGKPWCGESVFCTNETEVQKVLQSYSQQVVLKAPWSGSGRGLRFDGPKMKLTTWNWCRNLLEKQGGVEVEPFYPKFSDWALEFFSDGQGNLQYTGLSHFYTSSQNAWEGGMIGSEAQKEARFAQCQPVSILLLLRDALQEILAPHLAHWYCGHLGVDVMICRGAEGQFLLHPCVEVNLRRTMGQMACCLSALVSPSHIGCFEINYIADKTKRDAFLNCLKPSKRDAQGRLVSGAVLLTPIAPDSKFVATLNVKCEVSA